ncbi:MAG: transketolase C-terminal domain-containing protein [Nanoarchaeota archaeon]|nr:transketolase C-terminal domain-containing protein [Nanoarchaeota archaeon]
MTKKRYITYEEALNEALLGEMRRNPGVFVYGIDVADHKRTFGTGKGLLEEFGPERYFSTPLSEDALTGFGLGAAVNGLHPILVHIRVDFMLLAMNQLINMVATERYGSGGKTKAPFTIRAIIGRGWGQGFQHSKSLQSFFAHVPGLKVVMPTTPYDAKGLLAAAIRDENPTIVLEHRWLYFQKGEVPEEPYVLPIGVANVLRKGSDATVVATSWMNVEASHAADILEKERGVRIEIIDPRTISPLDDEAIFRSVRKTGHCVVADYDWRNCGLSAEIAARVSETCYGSLRSPIQRVAFPDTHCPTTRPLENVFYPNAKDIVRAVEKALKLKPINLKKENFYSHEHKFTGPF